MSKMLGQCQYTMELLINFKAINLFWARILKLSVAMLKS